MRTRLPPARRRGDTSHPAWSGSRTPRRYPSERHGGRRCGCAQVELLRRRHGSSRYFLAAAWQKLRVHLEGDCCRTRTGNTTPPRLHLFFASCTLVLASICTIWRSLWFSTPFSRPSIAAQPSQSSLDLRPPCRHTLPALSSAASSTTGLFYTVDV